MLQIRLSRGPSGDSGGGGGAAGAGAGTKPAAAPVETVTVACPDHLVLADLPVAKSLGAVTSSAHPSLRSLGRRSRRASGERVHFCVRCDFPIALYGRLAPCEHAFCLACARSDPSCYLCDERIQKIQSIKIMEGIFICAAPHCLKSFLKKTEFESHIHETHADLLQPQTEREGGNEADVNVTRASSTELHKQSSLPELSTARAPRPVFSPSSNSQDREEKNRRQPSRDQPSPKPPLQAKPPFFQNHPQSQPGDPQAENNLPQGFDRLQNWPNFQSFENQGGPQYNRDSSQAPSEKQIGVPPEFSFSTCPPLLPLQPPNFPVAMNLNQAPVPVPFSFPAFPTDGSQPYYVTPQETPQRDKVPENGPEQISVLGFPPAPAVMGGFPDNFARPWGMGFMGVPFDPSQVAQGIPGITESFGNPTDSQGGVPVFQGSYPQMPQGLPLNPHLLPKDIEMKGSVSDQNDGKGVLAPLPLQVPLQLPLPPPPPPPLPPPMPQQLNNSSNFAGSSDANREAQGYGWQSDNRGFGNGPD